MADKCEDLMGKYESMLRRTTQVEMSVGILRSRFETYPLSRTQISTQDVTQLCHEIRDIKKGPINNKLPDDLSKISSNIPGQWDIRDKRVLGYAENAYNKLCPVPPSDNRDSLARRDSSPPPGPPPPAQMPPGPPPFRTPSPTSETSVGTPYAIVAPGSGESPAVAENRARNSPCKS